VEAYSCCRKIVIKLQWLRVFERMPCSCSVSLRGVVLHITKPSRCGTAGKGKKHACLGLPDAIALE